MYLNALEEKRLLSVANDRTRLYHTALKYSETLLSPATLYRLADVPFRRAQLELRELVRRGWLKLVAEGARETRLVRYVSTARQTIESDRLSVDHRRSDPIVHEPVTSDRIRSSVRDDKRSDLIASSLIDSDLPSGSRLRKTEPSVRTEGMQGEGTDGRTDGSKKFADVARRLVGSIASDWEIPQPAVEKCVGRFFDELELEPGGPPTERELWRYFRAAFQHRERRHTHPAFAGIIVERFLGCTCTLLRFSQWREHERKREAVQCAEREREQREARDDDAALTPAQLLVVLEERARSVAQ